VSVLPPPGRHLYLCVCMCEYMRVCIDIHFVVNMYVFLRPIVELCAGVCMCTWST
jgi:hypothetical protein